MDEPTRKRMTAQLRSLATRARPEADQLAATLMRRSWPRTSADRTDPSALDWVRRWGPSRMGPMALECSCATGHCLLCN